ncbi:MAG: glycosyltransferase [Alphaproteobacteria bacterium]|nr:glycosyltransferase [Alphaproteobacteria bacterium]
MPSRQILVGLPAYNEEIALPRLLARVEKLRASLPSLSVVVYNDGSTDSTASVARQWQGRLPLELLDCPQNKGLGAGLGALAAHAAARAAGHDVLVVMDCDDTHDPAQIADMLARLDAGADIVIASRYRAGATSSGVPAFRRLTALGALVLFKAVHPVRGVRDYTCGYRAYRVAALKRAEARFGAQLVAERGFACTVELLLKLHSLGCRFAEIPLRLRYDLKPTASKMGVGSNIARLLSRLVRWRLRGFG